MVCTHIYRRGYKKNGGITIETFWKDKKVLITGHTGFKGSWLTLWLKDLGAEVIGYSLEPESFISLYNLLSIDREIESLIADIRDIQTLYKFIQKHKPDIIFHMASQPLVHHSYKDPLNTFSVNVMGTVNLLECIKKVESVRAFINVTTDKVYEDKNTFNGYKENDKLGGKDPYSSSKTCSEFITNSYLHSFFPSHKYKEHGKSIATARSGNVIGGGDWSVGRLIPDCVKSLELGKEVVIRNPNSIRPWQHVLDSLKGYILLAEHLYKHGSIFNGAWNFGPSDNDIHSVQRMAEYICSNWEGEYSLVINRDSLIQETEVLMLDSSKSRELLGWNPRWLAEESIKKVIKWHKGYLDGLSASELCRNQIKEFEKEGLVWK
ncbi:CDP-glucose 4,6-dehydratase [Metabacillus fastidiosus]|uniref:CDP-glucose 4,6-dehydratase n=1 Tax=Metabacillus fastidiosus TaxID=1458 RepID=UPI003D2C8C92